MKATLRAMVIIAMTLPIAATSQTVVLDFETPETTVLFQYFGSSLDPTTNAVIENPDASGVNTSAMVADFMKPAGAETWAGAFGQSDVTLDLTENTQVCIDVWFANSGNLAVKLENGNQANWIRTIDVVDTAQWVTLCYNTLEPSIEDPFTGAAGGVYNGLVLFFDFGVSPEADRLYYFDNVGTKPGAGGNVDVMFSVDMNEVTDTFSTVYVSGTFNEWSPDANPLSDTDGDGVWSGMVSGIPTGGHEYKFQTDGWTGQESLPAYAPCTKVDPSGQFINRAFVAATNDTIPTVCYESCYECGDGVRVTVNLGQGDITVSDDGLFLAGGGNFGVPGDFPLRDDDSDGVHTIVFEREAGFSSYFTFANGACGDFSCKENIAGQDCADPANFNDRFMGPITQDTVIATCFGECTTDTECGTLSDAAVSFSVDMSDYAEAFTTVYVSGNFNGWSGDANPMTDDNADGVWTTTIDLIPGDYEFKFQLDGWTVQEEFTDGDPCTITDPSGAFVNRALNVGSDDIELCYSWNTCEECETSAVNALGYDNTLFSLSPTLATNVAYLNFGDNLAKDKVVTLVNATGQVMCSREIPSGMEQHVLETDALAPGMYFVNVRTTDAQQTLRLMIVN